MFREASGYIREAGKRFGRVDFSLARSIQWRSFIQLGRLIHSIKRPGGKIPDMLANEMEGDGGRRAAVVGG